MGRGTHDLGMPGATGKAAHADRDRAGRQLGPVGQRAALVRDVFSTPARFLRRCRARHLIGVQVVAFVLMVGYSIRGLMAAIALERLRKEVDVRSYGFVEGAPSPACRRPLPSRQPFARALDAFRENAPGRVIESSVDFRDWESYVTGSGSSQWGAFTSSFWKFQPGLTVIDLGDGTRNSPHLVTYVRIWKSANDFIRHSLLPAAGPAAIDVTGDLAPIISGRRGNHMIRRKYRFEVPKSKVFTFVRSPISHFIAGYNEVEYRWTHEFGNYSTAHIPEYCEEKGCVFHTFPMGSADRVWAFLGDLLLGKLVGLREVGHVYAQLGALPKDLRLDFVGRLENFDEDWRHVVETYVRTDSSPQEYKPDRSLGGHNSTNFEAGESAKRLVDDDHGFVRVLEELLMMEYLCWGYPMAGDGGGGERGGGEGEGAAGPSS